MVDRRPTVAVVMPMRNAGPFIAAALTTLCGQETSFPFEIVVVNDASTDGCDEIVRKWPDPRIRMIDGGGRGEAVAVNTAVEHARGEIIMRCDADDLWPADRLEWQARWLEEHPEFGAVAGMMWSTDPEGVIRVPMGDDVPAAEITEELIAGRTRTSLCTFAMRRKFFLKTGGCRPYFLTAPDIDLQFRLAEVCRIWFEPRRCYVYRLHGQSVTHQQSVVRREFFERTAIMFAEQRRLRGTDDLMNGTPPPIPAEVGGTRDPRLALLVHLSGACWREHSNGKRGRALRLGWAAFRASGWRPRYLWNLVVLALKPRRSSGQANGGTPRPGGA